MGSCKKKLLLAVGALALACALAEGLLRVLEPTAVGVMHQPCIYTRDETNGYAYRPGSRDRIHRFFEMDAQVAINASGFHDVERPAGTEASAWRVAAIGDSFTACLHVPVADGWTQVLERELGRRRGTRGEVRNLGLDGTGTDVQVRILEAQLASGLRIDTVILAFYRNDVDDVATGRLYREVVDGYVITYQDDAQRAAIVQYLAARRPAAWVAGVYQGSLLVRALLNMFRGDGLLRSNFVWPGQVGLAVERGRAPQAPLEQAFRDLASLARRYSFAVLVAPVPARHEPRGSMQVLTSWVPAQILQPFAVVDVVPAVERLLASEHLAYRELFWTHEDHLNAAGNRLYALALADSLQPR
ncbi:MAG TPA: SGNH/GDSL hydrolase family protein [Planctomycetota bacterium]|nr:SGNH/GDSL hydrolase family protein [Planctomycetota bacterium]